MNCPVFMFAKLQIFSYLGCHLPFNFVWGIVFDMWGLTCFVVESIFLSFLITAIAFMFRTSFLTYLLKKCKM